MARTVRGLLLLSATILSSGLFLLVFFSLATVHEASIRRDAVDSARTLARVTFSSMFELMRTGWTRAQLDGFAHAVEQAVADSPSRIHIHRGERVERLFGPIDQPAADARLRHALQSGTDVEEHSGDAVRFIFPLRAEHACLRCHTNAAVGDVMGAIVVDRTIGATLSDNRERTLMALLPAVPIALLATVAMVAFINRRVQVAITRLNGDIAAVNRVADLGRLANRQEGLGFAEFDVLADGVRQLTERLRRVAVDRNMLEMELRLLEKFVITTDVVRDWHDYVLQLLRELNAVLPSRMLFSVFRMDGEYQVDVFWLGKPADDVRLALEKRLRASLRASYPGRAGEAPRISHHMSATGEAPRAVPPEAAAHRSLFVQEVKIGGIVGVGLAVPPDQEGGLALAIDGVLSTLLNVVGSVRAIHRYTSELEHYATRDPLTGLYNQRLFWELLENERLRAARLEQHFGLLLIDVDDFKHINDRFGHGFGDSFVRAFAATLRSALRAEDTLARYGGDEFVAILPAADLAATVCAAERVLDAVRGIRLTAADGTRVTATASIGMAVHPDHGGDGRDLFLFADKLMYRAKSAGRNRLATPGDDDLPNHFRSSGERNALVFDAVREGRIEPFFQPIVDTVSGAVVAVEALARLRVDDRPIPASEFMPVAERLGLLQPNHHDVVRRAMAAVAAAGFHGRLLVNVSPSAVVIEAFVREARKMAETLAIAPANVVFEVGAREAALAPAQLERFGEALHAAGFALAIEGVGADSASLQWLPRFSPGLVKIDAKLVARLHIDEEDRAVVRGILALAAERGFTCVAEGVESAEILGSVTAAGIALAQGYHVGRPAATLPLASAAAPCTAAGETIASPTSEIPNSGN